MKHLHRINLDRNRIEDVRIEAFDALPHLEFLPLQHGFKHTSDAVVENAAAVKCNGLSEICELVIYWYLIKDCERAPHSSEKYLIYPAKMISLISSDFRNEIKWKKGGFQTRHFRSLNINNPPYIFLCSWKIAKYRRYIYCLEHF